MRVRYAARCADTVLDGFQSIAPPLRANPAVPAPDAVDSNSSANICIDSIRLY